MKAEPVLTVSHLSKSFGGLKAVADVSFEVIGGTITSLIGPNGAGKTTIFNLISRLVAPDGGQICYKRAKLSRMPPYKIARFGVGRTFQEPRLFDHLTVMENVLVGMPGQEGEKLASALLPLRRVKEQERKNRARALEILEFLGLADRSSDLAENLSYGQQRFLSIARILATEPELLLMDEPTVGLHPEETQRLLPLLSKVVKEKGHTILLIEHNMEVAMGLSDWIILLVEGCIVAEGAPKEMKENPKLWEAYLGTRYQGISS